MTLDRISFCDGDVVAALDHPRTAAFAQQPFHSNDDVQIRGRLVRMQRSKKPSPTGAENKDIGLQFSDVFHGSHHV